MTKSAVLVTGHYFESKRRAGFHWIAETLWKAGWNVLFFTAPLSWLSLMRRDHRFSYPVLKEAGKLKVVRDRLESFVWFTPWHPANLRSDTLNRLAKPLFKRYDRFSFGEAQKDIEGADLLVFESTPALLLFERFLELSPRAKKVYRMSDDIRFLKLHPLVQECEAEILEKFDLVSIPNGFLFDRYRSHSNARLHLHGIHKEPFEAPTLHSPFDSSSTNAVFVGNSHFDLDFILKASDSFPDWKFHIIGPIGGLPERSNIFKYGEIPFRETIPFIKFADIGLLNRSYHPGSETLSDSLKVIQYSHCGLPVVAPEFLKSKRDNLFYYQPGDSESIRGALQSARVRGRTQGGREKSWDQTVGEILGEVGLEL